MKLFPGKLLTAAAGDGGSAPPNPPAESQPTPPGDAPPQPGEASRPPAPAPPPAAETVVSGEITEDTLKLRQERDELRDKLKRRDTDYSELERTHQEYRQTVEHGTPVPVKRKRGPLGVCTAE